MFKTRTPTADEKRFMDAVCSLGCIVCILYEGVQTPCSFHHIDGRTKKGAHYHGIGLCGPHHQIPDTEKPPRWHARHPNKSEFEEAYGSEMELYHKCLELLNA